MLGRYEEALSEFYAYQSIIADSARRTRALKIEALFPKVYGELEVWVNSRWTSCPSPTYFGASRHRTLWTFTLPQYAKGT